MFISDFAGTFLEANGTLLQLLGYSPEDIQSRAVHRDALTPPEHHRLHHKAVHSLHEIGSTDSYTKEYLHKNGARVPVQITLARIGQTETCIGCVLPIGF